MSSLARQIEEYIKALLEQENAGVVELQRNISYNTKYSE